MAYKFSDLKAGYAANLAEMKFTRSTTINATADRLLNNYRAKKYGTVPTKTGIPLVWIAASFEREASSNFACSPAQGDRWDRKSVHVPAGRGPFSSWEESALDAYHLDGLDKVGAGDWSWELCCYYGELFNGFGYRNHGIPSPYLWGGTNIQQPGKYVSDGVFDPNVMDQQLGIIPIMRRMIDLAPELDFTKGSTGTSLDIPSPSSRPIPKKSTVHPGSVPIVGAGAALMGFLHDHIWGVAIVAAVIVGVLIYLHRKTPPPQSPKALEPVETDPVPVKEGPPS